MESGNNKASNHEVEPRSDHGTRDRWFVLLFLGLDYFVLYLHRHLINYVQPPLQAELEIRDSSVADLQMAFILAYGFSQLFVGYLGDRFHRRTVLLWSLGASVLSLVGMGFAGSFTELIVLRVILGVAQSASVPAIASVMSDCFTARTRSTAVGVYLISQQMAMMVAGKYGGKIADIPTWTLPDVLGGGPIEVTGWRMSMFIFSAVGAAVLLSMFLFLREPKRTERQAGRGLGVEGASLRRTASEILRVRSYIILAAVFVLYCVLSNAREWWLPRYFHSALGMNLEEAGSFATGYVYWSTIAGLFAGGMWADRWARRLRAGRLSVQTIGLALFVPSLVVLGTATSKPLLVVAMVALGFGNGLYLTNLWTTTFEIVDPAARSTAVGFLNVVAMLAAPTSTVIGKSIESGSFGLGQAFTGLSVAAALAVLLLLLNIFVFLRHDYRGPLK